jgi:hypothetical protein
MQRMNCPVNHKEECSEECQAGRQSHILLFFFDYFICVGNTEEEIEEHQEITRDEDQISVNNKPKPKFESDINTKKQSNNSADQSTTKIDL